MVAVQRMTDRQGVSLLSFLLVFSPVMILLMSMAIDGLSTVATYRRALGLADVAARAGAATLSYRGGGRAVDTGWACFNAQLALCTSANCTALSATCTADESSVTVSVELEPPRMLRGPFAVGPQRVRATITAEPRSGIAAED
jgi:Flp pilus assembly protein TadG